MAVCTGKISKISFHSSVFSTPLCSKPFLSHLSRRQIIHLLSPSASIHSLERNSSRIPSADSHRSSSQQNSQRSVDGFCFKESPNQRNTTSSWLQQWNLPDPQPPLTPRDGGGGGSLDRIVHRLRSLGFGMDDDDDVKGEAEPSVQLDGSERLGDLLERRWIRPDTLSQYAGRPILPWEREENNLFMEGDDASPKTKRVRAPYLAELTLEDSELRRLRRLAMTLREKITVPKAGLTQPVMDKIHDAWRKSELARLKFHEALARNMKTAHKLFEHRTGGMVIWRSGSVMIVYRGRNYKRPSMFQTSQTEANSNMIKDEGNAHFVPDVSAAAMSLAEEKNHDSILSSNSIKLSQIFRKPAESMTKEEVEFDLLLDELGPRFVDWWGTGIPPVDADLLPQIISGYKTPFRLLPVGMRASLTNLELTHMRKQAKGLLCHFALGRNRNLQGLAVAILKLWEKSLVAKIAIKQGIQNTSNKLMAKELKNLTGGVLLLRNKYFIIIYRGKDFLPASVATTLAERQQLIKDIQDIEEKSRNSMAGQSCIENKLEGSALAGTLAEFRKVQAQLGRVTTIDERDAMRLDASKFEAARKLKKIEHKFAVAQAKKLRAEKLLAKIEVSMIPVNPSEDRETITDEERSVFRRIGLRMKAYLPIGIRGVFAGVIENMHLHWKHREIVKLIYKKKTLSLIESTARFLEHESGGILVSIEKATKGFFLIFYRGKNYRRPIYLRPRNLLTKAKSLERSVEMQRHEALTQHIIELETIIKKMKIDMGYLKINKWISTTPAHSLSNLDSDLKEMESGDCEDDYDSDFSDNKEGSFLTFGEDFDDVYDSDNSYLSAKEAVTYMQDK